MMEARAPSLTAAAFERLLSMLDPDRERAGIAYESLRERISGLFGWWGSTRSDDLTDETLDRVARKLEEGTAIHPASIGAYVRGVARLVFYESTREPLQQFDGQDFVTPEPADDSAALQCLDGCLSTFEPGERALLLRYYDGSQRSRERQRIAEELQISITALRIRMHRLRDRLEACVTGCVRRR
jgi:DNA-directed RNA polymerase specialized sigma24 family protein